MTRDARVRRQSELNPALLASATGGGGVAAAEVEEETGSGRGVEKKSLAQ